MPEISVIVPVYKAEAYLHACIDSILSQTFSGFELILVDDGSPDNCGAICDDYAARDSRVRVIHQENQGQAAARNYALAAAKGEWVCFVDSDDAVHPQMLERLRHAAAESGAAMSMCRMLEAPEIPEDFSAPVEVSWERLSMEEAPLVALFDAGNYPDGWHVPSWFVGNWFSPICSAPGGYTRTTRLCVTGFTGRKPLRASPTACIFTAPIPAVPPRADSP